MSLNFTHQYTPETVYPVAFGTLAAWIQVVGPGLVSVVNEDSTTATFTCVGGEVIVGAFQSLTAMSATRVRVGSAGTPMPGGAAGAAGPNQFAALSPGVDASVSPAPTVCVPALVGDVVLYVISGADGSDASADFESTISVNGQIQQTSADYTDGLFLVQLARS